MGITAYNQTTSSIFLNNLSITDRFVPASGSGSTVLTDFNTIFEIQADDELRGFVTTGSILLDVGNGLLDSTGSLIVLNASTGSSFGNNVFNTGSGQGVYLSKSNLNLFFRSLSGSGGTSVTSGSGGTIVISSSNITSSGETNTASNVGSGQGTFQTKVGVDLRFRSLTASGSISLISGSDTINISASNLNATNTGSGEGVFLSATGSQLTFRSISGSGNTIVTSGANGTIVVSSSNGTGEANTASNLGTGQGVFAQKNAIDLRFRSILGTGSITILSGTNEITISGTDVGENNTASNIGSGQGVFAQKNLTDLQFRSLTSSGSVSVVSGATTINISSSAILSGSVTGSGFGVFEGLQGTNLVFRSISGSGIINITSNSGTLILSASSGSGEANNASNIGSGQGIFQTKNGVTLQFRTLTSSGSISLISGSDTINISSSFVIGQNTGSGEGILLSALSDTLIFRSISGSGTTTVTSGANGTIIISSSAASSSGEVNTASNVGSGQGTFQTKVGVDLRFRTLTASGSISLISGSDTINISASIASGTNIGTGQGIFLTASNEVFTFRSISGSGTTVISSGSSGTIIISSSDTGETNTASNIGSGQGTFAQKNVFDLQFRSLTSSGSVSIISGSNTINISSSAVLSGSATGSGISVLEGLQGTNLVFRSLSGSGIINVSVTSGTLILSASSGSGEANTASNVGSGQGVFQTKNSFDLRFRSLTASGSTSIVSGSDTINISSSFASGQNTGSGEGIFVSSANDTLKFRSLLATGSVSIVSGASNITISSSAILSASNSGSNGLGVFDRVENTNFVFRSLSGSNGIFVLAPVSGTIVISGSTSVTNVLTNVKGSAKFATTASISLSGTSSVDTSGSLSQYNVTPGDRILVKNQLTSSQNGVYVAGTGSWVRADDYDSGSELTDGTMVWISSGYRQRTSQWMLTTNGTASVVVDTTPLKYTQNSSVENVEVIPFPETRTAGNTTRVGQNSFEGGSYFIVQPVRFNKILFKLTSVTNIPFIIMQIFQAPNGNAGMTRRVATVSSSFSAQGDFVLSTQEGEVLLEQGIFYVLWGKSNLAPNSAVMRTYSVQALDYVNQNMPVGVHPATFTTTINVDMNKTVFDPVTETTSSTLDIVPIIRLLNS